MSGLLEHPNNKQYALRTIKGRISKKLFDNSDMAEIAEQIVAKLDLKIKWIFLDDAALEKQTKAARDLVLQAIFDDFMRILESNLKEWYGTNNQYYWNLINNENLAWELFFGGKDTDTNQETFEGTMKRILNSGAKLPVLVKILKPRIKRILMEKHLDFETYHEHVIPNMEKNAQNKLQAELIFYDAKLEMRVREAVDKTRKIVQDDFLNKIWSSIEAWYPKNDEFNNELHKITDTKNFYLKPSFNLITAEKTVFENHMVPILKTPEYEPKVKKEVRKRIGSMLVGGYSEMKEYEEKITEKFMLLVEPESQVDLLFSDYDFGRHFRRATINARIEIEDQAFTKLEENLKRSLPNSREFVEQYVLFLKSSHFFLKELKNFESEKVMLTGACFRVFAETNKALIDKTIENQIRGTLEVIDSRKVDRNLELLKLADSSLFFNLIPTEILAEKIKKLLFTHSKWLFDVECASSDSVSGMIVRGSSTVPGEFPFLIALFLTTNEFFCGGSLITSKHILTAAHCVHEKGKHQRAKDDMYVLLGKYNLTFDNESSSIRRGVGKIVTHEDWNAYSFKYNADLAILVMDDPVEFTNSIRPICLTTNKDALSLLDGVVAGWGKAGSYHQHEELPRKATVQTVTDGECFQNEENFGKLFTQEMFCGKEIVGGPCHGDSGGSFSVKFGGFWVSKGIVSSGNCDTSMYSLYTKLRDFTQWINETVLANP